MSEEDSPVIYVNIPQLVEAILKYSLRANMEVYGLHI